MNHLPDIETFYMNESSESSFQRHQMTGDQISEINEFVDRQFRIYSNEQPQAIFTKIFKEVKQAYRHDFIYYGVYYQLIQKRMSALMKKDKKKDRLQNIAQ